MQSLGYIPPEYKSWDEVEGAFFDLTVGGGMSDKEAAEALGIDYRNVIGKGYLKIELSSKGDLRGLDKRSLREDIKPDEEAVLRQKLGDDGFKAYRRQRALEWGDVKPTKKDAEIIQAFTGRDPSQFVSTKVEADQVRDRLHGAFGNGGRGAQVHRGHGNSALEGASVGRNNLWPEWGPLNVGHGSAPRYDKGVMRNNNMSANDLQNYYDDILNKEGLNINPVAYHGTGLAADESLRELERPEVTGRRNSMGNPQTTAPVEPGRVSQDSIEWRNRRLYEYEQQIAAEAIKNGASPETAQALARQRVQELAFNQSGLTDTTQSVGGPVRQIQPTRPAPRQVGTVEGDLKLDPAGRLKLDRSGNPSRETRPLLQGDMGTIPRQGLADDVLYQAGLGPEAYQKLKNGLKVNNIGATLGAVADRNVGVKLGQGDVAGAVAQGGTNALIGAGIQQGLRIAARRAPAALAKLAGGTAGTGGLAGPMLAAAGAIDIADGFVEGATGKGFVQRGIEASPPVVRAAQQIPKVHNTVQSTLNPVNPVSAVQSLAIQAVKPPAAQRAKAAAGDPKAQMFINRRDTLTKVLTNPGNELRYFGGQLLNKLGIRK